MIALGIVVAIVLSGAARIDFFALQGHAAPSVAILAFTVINAMAFIRATCGECTTRVQSYNATLAAIINVSAADIHEWLDHCKPLISVVTVAAILQESGIAALLSCAL